MTVVWPLTIPLSVLTGLLWLRLCCSPHQPQLVYAQQRRWLDALFVLIHGLAEQFHGTYLVLQFSLCPDEQRELGAFSQNAANDAWLRSFPCSASMDAYHEVSASANVLSFRHVRQQHGMERSSSLAWLSSNSWWVIPYINTHYAFFHTAGFWLFAPAIMLLPLLAPHYWQRRGRTMWVGAWRLARYLFPLLEVLFLRSTQRTSLWFKPGVASGFASGLISTMKLPIAGMLPPRLHLRMVLTEAALMLLCVPVHTWHSLPLTLHWYASMALGALLGCSISALFCYVEAALLAELQHMLSHVWCGASRRLTPVQLVLAAFRLLSMLCSAVGTRLLRLAGRPEVWVVVYHLAMLLWYHFHVAVPDRTACVHDGADCWMNE